MKKNSAFSAWMSLLLFCCLTAAQAASVGAGGYSNNFTTQPAVADWATYSISGAGTDLGNATAVDDRVQQIAASSITSALGSDAGNPPAANASAFWSSSGQYIQTRPTGNAATLLLAKLINNLGSEAVGATITYTQVTGTTGGVADQVPGHRAFYSLTGAAGSWVNISQFSSQADGTLTATLSLNWPDGATLYLLWADDNADGGTDFEIRIDNFSVTATPGIHTPVAITTPPQNRTVDESQPVTFTVGLSGYPAPTVQWYTNGAAITGATATNYTITATPLEFNGLEFYVIAQNDVSNVTYYATSAVATLTVNADLVAPVLLQAGSVGLTKIVAHFSEPLLASSVPNVLNYAITGPGGVTVSEAVLDPSGTDIVLTVSTMVRDATYTLSVSGVRDRSAAANLITPNSQVQFVSRSYASQDIGAPATPGSGVAVGPGFTITGGGTNIAGISDQFFFYYQQVVGNFDYQVRVDSLTAADAWSKAGLMARETLTENSRFAMSVATPSYVGAYFLSRSTEGGAASSAGSAPVNYPNTWLRLVRNNTVFTGYASFDAQTWVQLGSVTLSTPAASFYLGFAVSSTDPARTVSAGFQDFGNVAGGSIVSELTQPWEPLGPASRNTGLVISEIMYHPKPSNDLEFVEIFNSGVVPEDLSGYRLAGSVDYTFPSGTTLPAGGFLVVARKPALLQQAHGITGVFGPWGKTNVFCTNVVVGDVTNLVCITNMVDDALPDDGGTVRLRHRSMNAVLLEVNYGAENPWPLAADGAGHSLVLARPSYGQDEVKAWAASEHIGGSPGRVEAFLNEPLRNVVINEFFANSDPPDEDFIELYNHSSQSVNLQGAWLSDDRDTNKFRITNSLVLPPRGFASFTQTTLGFALSSSGERIYLVNSNQTRVLQVVAFNGQAPGVASGRYPDGAPGFHELQTRTPGAGNNRLLIRDVVINEIMFHPPSENDDDQFLELHNRTAAPVSLANWRFSDGIEYLFPSNTIVPAGGFLVLARDKDRLFANYPQLNPSNTVGNFNGRLSFGGERLTLERPEYIYTTNGQTVTTQINWIPADEVDYVDAGRWARWADGGGSSLELIDPASDNRLAPNWADSDETQKSVWTNIVHSGPLDHGYMRDAAGNALDEIQVMLLGAGEALMDDVVVKQGDAASANPNLVRYPDFAAGVGGWFIQGNHVRSTLEPLGPNNPTLSMRIRASAGGDNGANRVECDLTSALPSSPDVIATISGRFRWLRGFPIALMRLHGGALEAVGTLPIPSNLGTPGLPNSRRLTNAGPAILDVAHSPVLPAANQAVVISAQVSDPDGIASVQLQYRLDPNTTLTTLPMRDDGTGGDAIAGDGLFSATLPGQGSGTLVAFRISATDTRSPAGATLFPPDAPDRECLVRFGDPAIPGFLGVYRLWMTSAKYNTWSSRERMSNEAVDGTFVYGKFRAIYNAGARYRGSPFTRYPANPLVVGANFVWTLPEDDLLLGTDELNIDSLEPTGRDATALREITSFTMAEQLGMPFSYQRFIRPVINGTPCPSPVHTDTQQPNGEYVAQWFPDGQAGGLYKVDDWFEFSDDLNTGMQGNKSASLDAFYTSIDGQTMLKQARYRWNWEKKFNAGKLDDDFTDLFAAVKALTASDDTLYPQAVEAVIEADEWLTALAFRHVIGDWDGYGYNRGKNQFIYRPAGGKFYMLLWDLDFSIGCNGGSGPTSGLYDVSLGGLGGSDHMPEVSRMYNNTHFRRIYMQALLRCADGPLQDNAYGPILAARYRALLNNGVTGLTSPYAAGIPSWITTRRDNIYGQVGSYTNVAFALSSPTTVTTANNQITITGNAPLGVKSIRVNGQAYPITWISLTSWSMRVPLPPGTTELVVTPYDRNGNVYPAPDRTVTATFTGGLDDPANSIIFSEIMFQPVVPGAEYVELFNRSGTTTFDLSGWRINGLDYTFPAGSVLAPRTSLVLVKDSAAHLFAYGPNLPTFDQYPGNLQAGGETLTLLKPGPTPGQELVVDKVRYEGGLPWNTNALATGSSLQLLDSAQDNSRPANWFSGFRPAYWTEPGMLDPGATNYFWRYVEITGNLQSNANFFIWMGEAGDIYIDDIKLVAGSVAGQGDNLLTNGDFESPFTQGWSFRGATLTNSSIATDFAHSGNASLHVRSTGSGSLTKAIMQTLSPRPTTSVHTLSYWFYTTMNGTNLVVRSYAGIELITSTNCQPEIIPTTYSPAQYFPTTTYLSPGRNNPVATNLPYMPPLWLNEIQPQNLSGLQDLAGHRGPWLELYNAGTNVESLEGLYLSDNYTNLTQWAFPAGASINPGECKVIFADAAVGESTLAELHTSFTLSPAGGALALSRLQSGLPQVLDYINYGTVMPDWSYGSFPNGQPFTRRLFTSPTPGLTNNPPPVTVLINEWMASNVNPGGYPDPADGQYDDWFELYNPSPEAADLGGLYLTDTLGSPTQWQIPAGSVIPPGGFILVWADGQTGQNGQGTNGDLHAPFNLRAGGEAIGLFAREGTNILVVDTVTFDPQSVNVSEGRYPDGSSHREFMSTFTPRASNVSTNPSSNTAPILQPIPDATVQVGHTLQLTFTAQDAEAPPQVLTFSWVGSLPQGATFNPGTGAFSWTPIPAQGPSSNWFTVRVTDSGTPSLSAERSFAVYVAVPATAIITPPAPNGDMTLGFPTMAGRHYRVDYKNNLEEPNWTPFEENLLGTGSQVTITINTTDGNHRFYRIVQVD